MKLNQIFKEAVDRTIEGVIKADDESGLVVEIQEYVLTNEVSKRLELFLEAYNNYQGANGAWVSGFFGSGKSHILKMLALLIENRVIEGVPALERFLPKCEDNAILRASLQKAVSIPSHSILFNIDQKADVISKTQLDALLAVFVKVFDEMCGYYGKQGYIASFERDLDKRGLLQEFKTAFRQVAGLSWESGREQALLEADNIAQTYAKITGSPAESVYGILDKYRDVYKVSIEDFALQVNEYVESQGKNFRLNFFVDEVGQYIAENTKLMTNLQTIAESLATKCRGRAWLIVTAQEDMDKLIGEMGAKKGNDFSKIQARFATRLKLTSQNVAVVIQKRLLAKNDQGTVLLKNVYREQVNNFGTLFDFSDGSQAYRNYNDQQHFIDSYPFIPYQFTLFQSAIQGLSEHGAFEGKNSSVGERSMLAVFQQVALCIVDHEVGQLATFDLMFEGIRNALKSQNQMAVLNAEKQLTNPLAVRVLKALLLVKYVKGFKATIHNLTVLMTERFGADTLKLRRDMEEALNLLEQQTYIQRNGDLYEYLTNEETDIEKEIKNTEADADAVSAELAKIIFDQVIKDRKIHYEETNQDFPFSRKLDDVLQGKEYEMAIHVISPFHEHFDQEETLRMHSLGRDELLIILPADTRLVQDLLMYKRTEKYIGQKISASQQESITRILTDKSHQNSERLRQIATRMKELLTLSRLFIAGNATEINSTDPLTRIVRGFHELIKRSYPNLKMLHGANYQENAIDSFLRRAVGDMPGIDAPLSEAGQELLAFIQSNGVSGQRTSLKLLDERFERKPYGWSLAAVQCTVAQLSAHGKVELRSDSNLLENNALLRALKNTQGFSGVVVEPQVEFSAAQMRRLKEFYNDFFDKPASASEAHELGKETSTALEERLNIIKQLANSRALYPFLAELNEPITRLQELVGKPYHFYLTEFPTKMDDLLDIKEQVISPILSFWNGPQKALYDEARQFHQAQTPNFDYLDGNEAAQLLVVLADLQVFKGDKMTQARTLVDGLKTKLMQKLDQRRLASATKVQEYLTRLETMADFAGLTQMQKDVLSSQFKGVVTQLQGQTLIARVNDIERKFIDTEYPQILARLAELVRLAKEKNTQPEDGLKIATAKVEYVSKTSIHVQFDKAWLADEADVDAYLQAWREALVIEIEKGIRIQI